MREAPTHGFGTGLGFERLSHRQDGPSCRFLSSVGHGMRKDLLSLRVLGPILVKGPKG